MPLPMRNTTFPKMTEESIDWDPAESETFSSTGRYDVGPAEPEDDDAEVTS